MKWPVPFTRWWWASRTRWCWSTRCWLLSIVTCTSLIPSNTKSTWQWVVWLPWNWRVRLPSSCWWPCRSGRWTCLSAAVTITTLIRGHLVSCWRWTFCASWPKLSSTARPKSATSGTGPPPGTFPWHNCRNPSARCRETDSIPLVCSSTAAANDSAAWRWKRPPH